MSFQTVYETMIDVGTRFGAGHLQIQEATYHDSPRRQILADAESSESRTQPVDGVVDSALVSEVYALISNEEKSFGAIIVGVAPDQDRNTTLYSQNVVAGSYLEELDDAVVGSAIARNLELEIGDELVVVGTDIDGSVAAYVFNARILKPTTQRLDHPWCESTSYFADVFGFGHGSPRLFAYG